MSSNGNSYPGGKGLSFRHLVNQIPPHYTFVAPFLGGGSVFWRKRPARLNIGIDADEAVIAEAMRCRLPAGAGHVREGEWWGCKGWQVSYGLDGAVRYLLLVGDALEFLREYGGARGDFFYCDPPYMPETLSRPGREFYNVAFPEGDHADLLRLLLRSRARVMLSGYWSRMYERELAEWRSFSFEAMTRGGRMATEWVWLNYEAPAVLHDWRWVGEGYRERERIKKMQMRWVGKLERMPGMERLAMLSAIAERFG